MDIYELVNKYVAAGYSEDDAIPKVAQDIVLLKIGKDFSDVDKNTFLKSLACICQDIMYGCTEFNTFGVERKDVPKTIKKLLNEYIPF